MKVSAKNIYITEWTAVHRVAGPKVFDGMIMVTEFHAVAAEFLWAACVDPIFGAQESVLYIELGVVGHYIFFGTGDQVFFSQKRLAVVALAQNL